MIYVEAGSFQMGSNEYDSEKRIDSVTISSPFWIGEFPVTQALWQAVMHNNPSRFQGETHPVERVSWDDICTNTSDVPCFLTKLNALLAPELAKKGITGKFALPSEVQWEYAARGGIYWQNRCRFAGSDLIEEVAWYRENSHESTFPVGMKMPNELGIYDMSGNVWEWCADHWHENYNGAPNNGEIWTNQNSDITKNE